MELSHIGKRHLLLEPIRYYVRCGASLVLGGRCKRGATHVCACGMARCRYHTTVFERARAVGR
jgi:hypothetical protein